MLLPDPGSLAYYAEIYNNAVVTNQTLVEEMVQTVSQNKSRYFVVATRTGVHWLIVAAIHMRECNFNFGQTIEDGSALPKDTTWEDDAVNVLSGYMFNRVKSWTLERALQALERYNGLGYLIYHPNVNTPYLWSMTNMYSKGKYSHDGEFDSNLVDKQCGCAALFKAYPEELPRESIVF